MLAGAGLGDDAGLAHPARQQRLTERVVELVRAGVVEILALEIHRTLHPLGEPLGEIQRRRPPTVVAQQARQGCLETLIGAGLDPGLLQFDQRRHQRLGHVLPPVGAEAVLNALPCSLDAHAGRPICEGPAGICLAEAKKARSLA